MATLTKQERKQIKKHAAAAKALVLASGAPYSTACKVHGLFSWGLARAIEERDGR